MIVELNIQSARVAVIGLGYVGLPLAVALSRHFPTTGLDIVATRIARLRAGRDDSGELSDDELCAASSLQLVDTAAEIGDCNVYIVAVPTPVNVHKFPDLTPLLSATRTVAGCLKRGDVVIYESTVYPGATEEECVPLLERISGLTYNVDFFCGYSPERINPGDRQRRLADIVKVTSGSTPEAAQFVDALYRHVVTAGTHLAPSIKVAEAAKAVENTQRDVNIALANELAMIFARLGIDTEAVLKAAETKWNFVSVRPGLVGGHCIGVDPYYLIHKAEEAGAYPELIKAARRINDRMSEYVTGQLLRAMALRGIAIPGARILIMGLAFKENCSDLRNTRVVEIHAELRRMQVRVDVWDPLANADEARHEHGIELIDRPQPATYDALLIAVAHAEFRAMPAEQIRALLKPAGVLFDAKFVLPRDSSDGRL